MRRDTSALGSDPTPPFPAGNTGIVGPAIDPSTGLTLPANIHVLPETCPDGESISWVTGDCVSSAPPGCAMPIPGGGCASAPELAARTGVTLLVLGGVALLVLAVATFGPEVAEFELARRGSRRAARGGDDEVEPTIREVRDESDPYWTPATMRSPR